MGNADRTRDAVPEYERVYRSLRRRILDGEMEPGETLTLRALAEEHDVSMTPAREAVRRLVAERALTLSSSGRISLPVPDAALMEELFRARLLLEPEIAQRAAARLTPAAIREIEEIDAGLGRALAAHDVPGYVRANTAFHARIYREAHAPALLALIASVWLQSAPLMRCIYTMVDPNDIEDFHAAAIEAAKAGDPRAVARAIRSDVAQGAAMLTRARLDERNL